MDLLERGRSLGELGGSLRWSDLRAFLVHSPPDSFSRRLLAPEVARRWEWTRPEVQLLGALYDQQVQFALLRAGKPVAGYRGVVSSALAEVGGVPAEPVVKKRQRSAAEVRAAVLGG